MKTDELFKVSTLHSGSGSVSRVVIEDPAGNKTTIGIKDAYKLQQALSRALASADSYQGPG